MRVCVHLATGLIKPPYINVLGHSVNVAIGVSRSSLLTGFVLEVTSKMPQVFLPITRMRAVR